MDTSFLATRHDPAAVAAACLLAASASYVSLELARRVYTSTGKARLLWWAGGAVTMGTGIWAMHFIAMLGFEAGLPLGFALGATTLSWLAAIAAGAVGLACARLERLSAPMLLGGATAMAAAICGMHYIGMAALELTPGIVWRHDRVIGSVLVAWTASAVALGLFFAMRRLRGPRRLAVQGVAALVMGAAISGMHFLGMAAAQLPLGTVCTSSDGLAGRGLLALVASATLLLLGAAMLLAVADARHQARQRRLARSLQAANTELQQANAELHRLAYRDPLTGASNRAHLEDRLQHACALLASQGDLPRHGKARLAVLFIDLDGFKPVNDSFGHACGDALLQQVVERLARAAPGTDTVARVGGDEFVVLLESADALASGIATAEDLLAALRQPFVLPAHEVTLSASIGIAVHPDHGSADTLVSRADAAMYAAKARGGGGWAVYDAQMTQGTSELVALQQALRGALARDELSLHYQPKVSAHDGAVHGLEALLRWHHPPRGMVSPAVFIPVAERFGLIGALGRWVIDEACAQMARWNAVGLTCRVAVNLSPLQLRQTDLADQVADALARHRIEPAQLVLEITETAMMENLDQQLAQLERLAGLGVRLSIDDFGTGYSCLAWLRRLPVRQLKLDRSLVIDVTEAEESRAVVDAVVRLAHALRLEVVAEGVETEPQAAMLRTLGCDVLQGWLFARPMPADELPAWLARHGPSRPGAPGPGRPACAAAAVTAPQRSRNTGARFSRNAATPS